MPDPKSEKKKAYDVKSSIRHSGNLYRPDDDDLNIIELTAKEAAPLIACNAISKEPREDKAASEKKPSNVSPIKSPAENDGGDKDKAPTAPAERITAIKAAIATLDKGDESLWLKDGETPDVKAIEAVLGYDITAGERNEAMG